MSRRKEFPDLLQAGVVVSDVGGGGGGDDDDDDDYCDDEDGDGGSDSFDEESEEGEEVLEDSGDEKGKEANDETERENDGRNERVGSVTVSHANRDSGDSAVLRLARETGCETTNTRELLSQTENNASRESLDVNNTLTIDHHNNKRYSDNSDTGPESIDEHGEGNGEEGEAEDDSDDSESENIVCFGQGEDDSDEVSEDETDVVAAAVRGVVPVVAVVVAAAPPAVSAANRGKDAPFGQTVVTDTANNSLNEVNDDSFDDDDAATRGRDANASSSPGNATMAGADNRAVYALMQTLDQERSVLMKEIESEDQHRVWFYRQLETITGKLETLPLSDTYNLQADMARRQLEFEAQQVQGVMTEKLGSAEQSSQRQEARLRRIRTIESELMQLQQQQQLVQRAPAVSRRDVGTSTTLNRAMFSAIPGQEAGGYACERVVAKTTDGRYLATVAVQTADVTLTQEVEGHGGMAAGMPLNADAAAAMYHGAWPIHKDMSLRDSTGGDSGSVSSVMSFNSTSTGGGSASVGRESSVMSFNSNNSHTTGTSQSSAPPSATAKPQPQQLGTKVEMVYSLLSMLGTHDKDDMSRTLLAMSSSQDSCIAMRQSGCLPLLIQLLHGSDKDSGLLGNTRGSAAARARASAALHNIVHSNPDDKRGRREARTLRLLEQIRAHCDQQRGETAAEEDEEEGAGSKAADIDHHPGPAIAALMKLSFDEDYRHAICTLGGLQAMAELLEVDHTKQGNTGDNYSITVRRYACMALTNLTFGDGKNKALLCSMQPAMHALVAQLRSPNEDLCQGAASVLRNLSWRADLASKKTLREVGAVTTLTESAMAVKKETTLKSILSALWNLSSHCSENKAEICAVKGALEFLVSLLTFKSGGKTHAIVENGGGILRNVSSQIAIREDYRRTLRQKGCLQILLAQLRSTSLTIVSNACGTLWNLSARCSEDQELLRDMGAVGMLRNLVHSKHRMIAMGSSAALRNLLSSAGSGKGMDCDRGNHGNRPTLSARKQRALEEELDAQNLSETCENVESPRDSPTDTPPSRTADGDGRRFVYPFDPSASNTSVHKTEDDPRRALHRRQVQTRCDSSTAEGRVRSPQRVPRASSQDSVTSTHSDISHDRSRVHHMLAKSSHLLHRRQGGSLERKKEPQGLHRVSSEHACSALERGGKNGAQSSRIVRYMQEVAMLAGVGAESNPTPAEPSDQSQHSNHSFTSHHAQSQSHRAPPVKPSQQKLYEHLVKKNVGLNLDYDRGDDSDNSEQPVNYSLKYQDTPTTMYPEPSVLGMNVHPTSLQGAGGGIHGNVHPGPRAPLPRGAHGAPTRMPNPQVRQFHPGNVRVNNYVGPNVPQPRHVVPQNVVHGRFPAPHNFNPSQSLSHRQPQQQRVQQQQQPQRPGYTAHRNMQGAQGVNGGPFSAYAETDLDSMDEQPTDFSLRYAEDHSDDQDQPVNYSMRYRNDPDPDCVECKYEEARRTNDRLDQSANDDQVLTFCTEGTPFLSTATSLTDLTGGKQGGEEGEDEETKSPRRCHHRHQEEEEEEEEDEDEGGDEVHNFSARYGESEDTPGNSSCGHTGSTVRPSGSGAQGHRFGNQPACQPTGPQQTFHNPDDEILPPDQMKTYCEEGTPVCFSRVSSLSSLHSSEARDSMDQGRPVMLQSIEESEKGEMSTSVIENKNAIGMKAALVDRRNRGTDTPVEKESKTVTFDESRQQQQVEETPLMFSRCSSLGSLSSFDTQSVHSSVVSEYSRRASQVVSPSELPDSPSETMPPSPTRLQSPPVRSFKPVVAAAASVGGGGVGGASESAMKSGQIGNKVDWQRGAEDVHIQVDDELAKLLNIFRSSIPTNNTSNNNNNANTHHNQHHQHDDAISMSGKSEVPVVYADEGTPPVWSETWSETSSLSALTVDGDAGNAPPRKKPVSAVSAEPNLSRVEETDSADVTLCETQDNTLVKDDKDSSMSEVSEGEEDILAQCISAAMPAPTNSSRKMRKSGSDNAIKKKSALPKPEPQSPCSGASKMSSRLPTKVMPQGTSTPLSKSSKLPSPSGRLAKPEAHTKKGANSSSPVKQGGGNAAKPPRPAGQTRPQTAHRQPPPVRQHSVPDDDFAPDTMKTFAEEGTPLNFSAATSLSDLSCVTDAPGKIQSPPSLPKSPEDCKSDTSSLCEESEQQLLNDMIQAAMPKARTARKLDLDKSAASRGQNTGTKAAVRGGPAKQREEARKPPQRQQQQQQQQQQQHHQQQQRQTPATKSAVQMEVPYAGDTTQTYATEGTPNNFSAATSLSDLTIDSVDDGARGGRLSSGRSPAKSSHQQGNVATAYSDDGVFGADGTDSPHVYGMEGTPTTFSRNDSLSSIEIIDDNKSDTQGFTVASSRQHPNGAERHVVGQSSEEGSVKSQKHRNQPQQQQQQVQRTGNKDETQQFEMEDTPVSFSRNSSLSSLASGGRAKEPQPEEEPQISRTSSTESLSAESAGFDPTPSEQALLDQCINAAMPKRRPSRGEDRSRRHSRTATKNEGRALLEGGSLKNSALEIRAQFEDTASVGGETTSTTASVTLTAHGERSERREKLMTRSCSDALDMESDDGGARPSRFSSWRKNRHGSSTSSSSAHPTKQSREESGRSHSQDNLLKTQKEICNRITQSVESSSASSSNSTSRSAQSCTTSVIHVDPAATAALGTDNRLVDRHHRDTHAPHHHPDHPMVASTTDSSSSGEKADSEKAFSDDHHYQYHTPHFELKPAEDYDEAEEDDDDVDHQNQTVMEVGNRTLTQRGESFDDDHSSQHDLSQDVVHYEDDLEEKLCFGSGHTSFDQEGESGHASFDQDGESGHASFEQEITPEDELLLQQNASLIVSEICTKRDMTGSALDDDLFIENETISLVSNDYTSDTASEVSISWSTTSEKMSDRCSSQAETLSSCSAKVVKPESKLPRKTALEEDDGKAVRGRRKPLYTKPSPSSALRLPGKAEARSRPGSGGGGNSRPTSGTGGGNSRPTSGGAVGNAKSPAGRVGGGPQKKTSPRTPGGQPKSNLPGPKTSTTTPGSQKPSPPSNPPRPSGLKTTAAGKLQSPAGPRPGSGSGSGIPRSPAKVGTTPPSRLPAATNRGKDATERPKPPTKQATFVKDTPTPRDTTNNVRLRTRSASRGRVQAEKRSSGCEAAAQRNSTGSPPEAWSKALDSFNFVVDKSGDGGGPPYKQIHAQRNAKDAPGAVKRNTASAATPTVKQQPRPSNIARPQGMGSSPKSPANTGKPGSTTSGPKPAGTSTRSNLPARTSNTNLNKSGSASSLRKTGSGSSLTKTNSGGSLNKGPTTTGAVKKPGVGKVDIKKSESSASLRRGSDGSRPTTPNGRRPSNPRTPDKGGEEVKKAGVGVGVKKQVPSKIASLWKKEEAGGGVQRSFSVEDHALAPATTKPRNKSSSLPASARNMSISSLTFVRKSSSVNSQSSGGEEQSGSSTEVIPRSSTYDKFPVAKSRGMAWQNSEDEDSAAVVSSGEGMLELCDPAGDESENQFESLESGGGDVNLDEAYIHEDPEIAAAEREAAMACSVDSLEDASVLDNSQLSVTANVIDSSTWRRNKKPVKTGDVSLNLPNADETCRSMNSFLTANDSQNESLARGADMSVWQSCGNDSTISEISFANHDASAVAGGKKSKSKKSVAKSIKSTFAGLKFFGSKQSKSKKFTTDYIEPKIVTHHTTGTSTKTISVPTSKPSPGAIVAPVAPFNYSPPASTPVSVTTTAPTLPPTAQITKDTTTDVNGDKDKKTTKHMTKTEMLLARRKQSFLSTSSKDDGSETESSQRGCMVTTV